jgi:hypothetical protein
MEQFAMQKYCITHPMCTSTYSEGGSTPNRNTNKVYFPNIPHLAGKFIIAYFGALPRDYCTKGNLNYT